MGVQNEILNEMLRISDLPEDCINTILYYCRDKYEYDEDGSSIFLYDSDTIVNLRRVNLHFHSLCTSHLHTLHYQSALNYFTSFSCFDREKIPFKYILKYMITRDKESIYDTLFRHNNNDYNDLLHFEHYEENYGKKIEKKLNTTYKCSRCFRSIRQLGGCAPCRRLHSPSTPTAPTKKKKLRQIFYGPLISTFVICILYMNKIPKLRNR